MWRAAAVLIGWLIVVLACGRMALIVKNSRYELYDFAEEWTSAKNFLTGAPIYESMDVSLPRYFPRLKSCDLKYNGHPPFSVLLCVPFGSLPYHQAYWAWSAGSLVLTGVAVRMIAGRSGLAFNPVLTCGLTLALVTSNAWEQQILQGQWNCVLLCLLSGAWLAERRGRLAWSGALIGIAATVKLFPAFMLVYFVARREWRAVVAGAVTIVVLNAVTAAVLGGDAYASYFGTVTSYVAQFRDTWPNASLLGYWSKLFDGGFGHVQTVAKLPLLARVLALASAVILVGDLMMRARDTRHDARRDAAFAMAVIAMLLASPITWDHYFVILALPSAILWRHANTPPQRTALFVSGLLLATLSPRRFWILTLPGYAQWGETAELATPWMTVSLIAFQTYLLIGLYLLARKIWRCAAVGEESRSAPEPSGS